MERCSAFGSVMCGKDSPNDPGRSSSRPSPASCIRAEAAVRDRPKWARSSSTEPRRGTSPSRDFRWDSWLTSQSARIISAHTSMPASGSSFGGGSGDPSTSPITVNAARRCPSHASSLKPKQLSGAPGAMPGMTRWNVP